MTCKRGKVSSSTGTDSATRHGRRTTSRQRRLVVAHSHPMAARLVLLLASGHLAASSLRQISGQLQLACEKLRQDILGRPYFNRIVAPTSDRKSTGTDYSDAGTDVFMQIRFFKVQTVNAAEGWMRLKVWMRMGWKDTRLAWDPNDYSGLDTTCFQGDNMGGSEVSEIWIPDVQPYNANNGIILTLEPALARVSSDGSVFLSRPGSPRCANSPDWLHSPSTT